ncbi:MAG: ribonuclease P protein component [Thermoguttaceae bacterium]|nr:ribonuclease P protein component [Thermoguttaceae bacterium]MBR5243274.1 ribonuclease P protein component [Thermoguttaceae bacterium]
MTDSLPVDAPETSVSFRFDKARKIKRTTDFQLVYRARIRVYNERLTVCCRPTAPDAPSRLGLSVSKKVGKAFVRNRWKRLLREAFRLQRRELPTGFDFIAIPTRQDKVPSLEILADDLLKLSRRCVRKAIKRGATAPTRDAAPPLSATCE